MMNPRPPSVATLHDLMALIEIVKSPEAFKRAVEELFAATAEYNQAVEAHKAKLAELQAVEVTVSALKADARAEAEGVIKQAAADKQAADALAVAAQAQSKAADNKMREAMKAAETAARVAAEKDEELQAREKNLKTQEAVLATTLDEATELRNEYELKLSRMREMVA